MRIGILADIHEDTVRLTCAIDILRREVVDQFVVLGDIFDSGKRIDETVSILKDAMVIGVWGNHDLGLCHAREPWIFEHFSPQVIEFFETLESRLELGGAVFTHGASWWDPTDPTVYYLAERHDEFQDCFDRFDDRLSFLGHFHRWSVATPGAISPWDGTSPLSLDAHQRYQIIIHAVMNGWCALYDTESEILSPFRLD
jgi:predicted phosphodiesterase